MTRIHAGATLDRPPGPKYRSALRFAEIALGAPLPRVATLARWREALGDDMELGLVAPRPTLVSPRGPLRLDDDLEDAVGWLLEAADALAVRALVFPTGAEVTTGQRDRDRLAAYFDRIPEVEGRLRVWAPAGLWEPDMAEAHARALGLVYGFDPLEAPVPAGPVAYGRLRAIGARRRFGEGLLFEVQDRLQACGAEEAYVTIESPRSFREAVALQQAIDGADDDGAD